MKTTTKRIVIKKKPKAKSGLNPAERGVLWYMLETRNQEGLFQQHDGDIAKEMNTTRPTIHRIRTSLIEKGAVEVVAKSHRGHDGWLVSPVLRPIPPTGSIYASPRPSPLADKERSHPSQLVDKEQASEKTSPTNGLGHVVENTTPILVHSDKNPSPNGQQKLSTVNGSFSELVISDQHGSRAGRTVVAVEQAPTNELKDTRPKHEVMKQEVYDAVRARQKARAEEIRRRNAQ
jgi:hypothetical protein